MADVMSTPVTDLSVDLVKTYLRVDYTDDDVLIQNMLDAARSMIQTYLNRSFNDFETLPSEFTIAALSLCGEWYSHRQISDEKQQELPLMYQSILCPYREWAMGDLDGEN
jgi:uncharacterized phage protein (predicted DNA packaging)